MTHTSQQPVLEKQNKYGSVRCWSSLCQRTFASKAERARGEDLYMQQKAGIIFDLEYQPSWTLCKKPKITYTADFKYKKSRIYDTPDGRHIDHVDYVEDVKGMLTRETRIKIAWLKEQYGVEVELIKAGAR